MKLGTERLSNLSKVTHQTSSIWKLAVLTLKLDTRRRAHGCSWTIGSWENKWQELWSTGERWERDASNWLLWEPWSCPWGRGWWWAGLGCDRPGRRELTGPWACAASCLCCWSSVAIACWACCCMVWTKCCMCWKASICRTKAQGVTWASGPTPGERNCCFTLSQEAP